MGDNERANSELSAVLRRVHYDALKRLLAEKDAQIATQKTMLKNVGVNFARQYRDLQSANERIEALTAEKVKWDDALEAALLRVQVVESQLSALQRAARTFVIGGHENLDCVDVLTCHECEQARQALMDLLK